MKGHLIWSSHLRQNVGHIINQLGVYSEPQELNPWPDVKILIMLLSRYQ